jgi:hypothetical protein
MAYDRLRMQDPQTQYSKPPFPKPPFPKQPQPEVDRVVVIEVMVERLDRAWWKSLREDLEVRLRQEEIVVRCFAMDRL